MKKVCLIILVFTIISCSKELVFYKDSVEAHNYLRAGNNSHLLEDNSYVELEGIFNMDFENVYLEHPSEKIWLEFDFFHKLKNSEGKKLDGKMLKEFNGKKIKIKGKLSFGNTGHLSAYKIKLTEIVFLKTKV
jgi:hypothetical protein